jgi:hypothetical protein
MSAQRDFRLYLSARQADNWGSNTRNDVLTFDLSEQISARTSDESIYVTVQDAVIPSTMLAVSETSNTLKYTVGATQYTLVIEPQLYTPTTLAVALTSAFSANDQSLTVAFNANKARLAFTWNVASVVVMENTDGLASVIGVATRDPYTLPASAGTVLAPHMVDLAGPRAVCVVCDELEVDSVDSTRAGTTENVLCSVPITAPFGGMNHYQSQSIDYSATKTRHLNRLTLRLLDEDMDSVNLNGSEWYVVLRISISR